LSYSSETSTELEIDLSDKNINDSQLAMIFVVCHACNPPEAQVGLALNLLCGFGVDEIASAFLSNNKTIYKRLQRAKQKLRSEQISIEQPDLIQIDDRLQSVAMTLYLLFNEGYYSSGHNYSLRRELCAEAIRLTVLLVENEVTNKPFIRALLALMYFQSSRFEARIGQNGESVLYQDQDSGLWDQDLIVKGVQYLNQSSMGDKLSKYHLEAGIAYWHTYDTDNAEKWENILQLYNQLLLLEYSPIAALNRTYALAKANGKELAIIEAEKINLEGNYLYHSLLGELYSGVDNNKSIAQFRIALNLVKSVSDQTQIRKRIRLLEDLLTP
jgi:predicted RNA polymerase sigma factor